MPDRIQFISEYCDRWCERCPFTQRCSAHAVRVATEMCGDLRGGLELALGIALPAERPAAIRDPAQSDDENAFTEVETAASVLEEEERGVRIGRLPTSRLARLFVDRAIRWLADHQSLLLPSRDAVLSEAVQTVAWDVSLIGAKLFRAQHGRDSGDGDAFGSPIQSDWNGSAKVALLSLERSEAAWQVIAVTSRDRDTVDLVSLVGLLRRRVAREFPDAMAFVRPGFDEPWIRCEAGE